MKRRKTVFTATLVVLAFALVPIAMAAPHADGGPIRKLVASHNNATNEAGAQMAPDDILPVESISFAPVGLILGQTVRLNLVNINVPNGLTVSCRFFDAAGVILAQSVTTLSLGKITSVDFRLHADPLPGDSADQVQVRAEVRAQIDILYGASSDSLRRSLEVFNTDTGMTTVYMGGS